MITELRCILVYFTHDVFYVGLMDRTDQTSEVLRPVALISFGGEEFGLSEQVPYILSWHSLTLFSLTVMHSTTLGLYSRSPAI